MLKTTAEQRAQWRYAHKYDSLQETHDFYPDGVRDLLDDFETLLGALAHIEAAERWCVSESAALKSASAHARKAIAGQGLTPEEPGEG